MERVDSYKPIKTNLTKKNTWLWQAIKRKRKVNIRRKKANGWKKKKIWVTSERYILALNSR